MRLTGGTYYASKTVPRQYVNSPFRTSAACFWPALGTPSPWRPEVGMGFSIICRFCRLRLSHHVARQGVFKGLLPIKPTFWRNTSTCLLYSSQEIPASVNCSLSSENGTITRPKNTVALAPFLTVTESVNCLSLKHKTSSPRATMVICVCVGLDTHTKAHKASKPCSSKSLPPVRCHICGASLNQYIALCKEPLQVSVGYTTYTWLVLSPTKISTHYSRNQ